MKKQILLSISVAILLVFPVLKSEAQYYITSHYWSHDTSGWYFNGTTLLSEYGLTTSPDSAIFFCSNPDLFITTNVYDSALSIKTYFGDGTNSVEPVIDSGGLGFAACNSPIYHLYFMPGVYSIKQVLYYGSIAVDSISGYIDHYTCNAMSITSYYDSSGAGHFVPGVDILMNIPMQFIVDSDGITLDTVNNTGSFYYDGTGTNGTTGIAGTVYSFKPIPPPAWTITAPLGGIIYDTTTVHNEQYFPSLVGFRCSGLPGFDLAVNANTISGRHHAQMTIEVTNDYCTPQDVTLTMHFSPKYNFTSASIAPTSVSGNTVVWSLPGVCIYNAQFINVSLDIDALPYLIIGDTIHYDCTVTPITGDVYPGNNTAIVLDTVTGSFDPNDMVVVPSGFITSGTQLQYSISFENTGNDTAFNISIYDTLSNNVDIKSLNVVSASALMNIATINNVVKFNFPHINLLDSAHHDLCDGMVVFTVNSKNGLASGTTIFNEAGIYFDDNPVVMTNTVEDIIGFPSSTAAITNASKILIYPNPASETVTIDAGNGLYNTAAFTNVLGQEVESVELNTMRTQVNVSSLIAGIYYITLRGEGGSKVIKFEKAPNP